MTVSILVNELFENPQKVAEKLHNAYVSGGADSMQNESKENYFIISSIETHHEDETFTVHILRKSIKKQGVDETGLKMEYLEYFTDPLSKEELIQTLCGGKLKAKRSIEEKVSQFNTKEATFEFRIQTILKLLNDSKIDHNKQEIIDLITHITLNDNSKGILATHWIHSLENTHGFTPVELMHMLWCMYINWDDNAEVLSYPLPLTDDSLISKDRDVLSGAQEILKISDKETTNLHHSDIELDIRNVLLELQHQFLESSFSLIFAEDIDNLTQYFVSRYEVKDGKTQVDINKLNDFRKTFQNRLNEAMVVSTENAAPSFRI